MSKVLTRGVWLLQELQALGEAVGVVSRGLRQERIDALPTAKCVALALRCLGPVIAVLL